MPQHHAVDGRHVQPRHYRFTADRRACQTQCAQCHVNNNYSLTSAACCNCHLTDYNGTNNPPHKSAGFPQDCTLCHSTTNWTSATFNHATTGFALTGAHTATQCAAVPREQQLQPDQRGLLELPPDRLQRHHQPAT